MANPGLVLWLAVGVNECLLDAGKVCSSAGQYCVDPTPNGVEGEGGWWCHCVEPFTEAAMERPAVCGQGTAQGGNEQRPTDAVMPSVVNEYTLTTYGGTEGWKNKVASLLNIDPTSLSASQSGDHVWLAFHPPTAQEAMTLFYAQTRCCPLPCTTQPTTTTSAFCSTLGITSNTPLKLVPCLSLTPVECPYHPSCTVEGLLCVRKSTLDPFVGAILGPLFVTLGCIAAVLGLYRFKRIPISV